MGYYLATLAAALSGGWIGIKIKMPAGALIGSMLAVAAFNLLTGKAAFPSQTAVVLQCLTGAYMGAKIGKREALDMLKSVKAGVLLSLCMCLFSTLVSFLIVRFSAMDPATALFSTAPGGIADMSLIALEMGADPAIVAIMQVSRIVAVVMLMPALIKRIASKMRKKDLTSNSKKEPVTAQMRASCSATIEMGETALPLTNDRLSSQDEEGQGKEVREVPRKNIKAMLLTLAVGLTAGIIGRLLKIPAGAITFSMIACAAYHIKTDRVYLPKKMSLVVQIFAGLVIGLKMDIEQMTGMSRLLPVIFPVMAGYIVFNLAAAALLSRFARMDGVTALYASASGGLGDMTILADQAGADSVKVLSVHLMRYISVLMLYPYLTRLLLTLFT